MMGDTGPCGPCSELHIDLTPGAPELSLERQRAGRELVNSGDARCIEIWNLVFIQFNANPDGTFVELPAKHVDTGMGFERVTSMIQGTMNFTDFEHAKISNYETDVFRPLFDELEKITGRKYKSTLPKSAQNLTEDEKTDVAFRVIADHIRTLSFSIADGIQPSNEGRGYVLRRILRRAVRYGRNLGLREPFLGKLVMVLDATMGHIFQEVVTKAELVKKMLKHEEESFGRTVGAGFQTFELAAEAVWAALIDQEQTLQLTRRIRIELMQSNLSMKAFRAEKCELLNNLVPQAQKFGSIELLRYVGGERKNIQREAVRLAGVSSTREELIYPNEADARQRERFIGALDKIEEELMSFPVREGVFSRPWSLCPPRYFWVST